MEVDKNNWKQLLVPILKDIANASFVSFDLEMSGISTRPKYTAGDRSHDVGKPTLQKQYEEVKEAAETFQVLQLGITCVEEDREKEFYLARPYNINLSPLFLYDKVFDLERNFTFSSSATHFLQSNGFDIGAVFSRGVPYLSEEEEIQTRLQYESRSERNATIPDIVFNPDDFEALNFYRGARNTITDWIEAKEPKNNFVNIDSKKGALNGYQRRLIYQLVRKEFPEYRCFPRLDGSFMQIEKTNKDRETKVKIFNERVAVQMGIRFIFEALSGGNLSGIDPLWSHKPASHEEDTSAKRAELAAELKDLTERLQEKQHVIVGHNLFTDLCFLYKTFIGRLPAGVSDFQSQIHTLFPIVIDTKYLATYGNNSMNPRSNLKELLVPFQKIHKPLIVLHEDHNSYGSTVGKSHEAGYDSWMTAELFTKLSAKLYAENGADYIDHEDDLGDSGSSSYEDDDVGGAPLLSPTSSTTTLPASLQLNKFAVLAIGDPEPEAKPKTKRSGNSKAVAFADQEPLQWIPDMDNPFWDVYANKLRVNAAEGGVCDLDAFQEQRPEDRVKVLDARW
ncbi:CAF1 family ribonuclease protein [Rutstroemia sp. NJR-2017a WRK4]|nr:CAF1 family ribonuclease protein [Rutstroemia sp. NJR-2017a WRK4]